MERSALEGELYEGCGAMDGTDILQVKGKMFSEAEHGGGGGSARLPTSHAPLPPQLVKTLTSATGHLLG